jgi:predicted SAM-dependent methyltransferase/GT2 family glycosyltransferase
MKIGIVTIAFRLAEATDRLLQSIDSENGHEIEVHLFRHSDHADVKHICEMTVITNECPYIDYVYYPHGVNRGLSKSWNEGMLNAYRLMPPTGSISINPNTEDKPCDVVIIVNDDAVFARGDVDRLAEYAAKHRQNYVITCVGFNQFHKQRMSIGYSCFAINPVAIERIGCFDESFFPIYYEDIDYMRRAHLAGLEPGHCADTDVLHGGSVTLHTADQEYRRRHNETFQGNEAYYVRKWGGLPGAETSHNPFSVESFGLRIAPEDRNHPYGEFDRVNPVSDPPIPQPLPPLQREGEHEVLQILHSPIRLDIGCGNVKREGWIGVDAFNEGADIMANMWELPYGDGEVDEIYTSHALEHVGKFEVVPTLKEWARVIRAGGVITIRVPDLVWCCKNWLRNQDDGWNLAVLFGHQCEPGEFHKTGFTRPLMEKYLAEAGLRLVSFQTIESHGQPTMEFICKRAE